MAAIARLAKWLSHDNPAWAVYRALMAGRLIAIDKSPEVRPLPLFIGEAKCVLSVSKGEAQEACGIDQLCGELQAVLFIPCTQYGSH